LQLEFLKNVTPLSDLLPDEGAQITLKDTYEQIVDRAEYNGGDIATYVSLERGDPSLSTDADFDAEFDGWYRCDDDAGSTPGADNVNEGMREFDFDAGEYIEHSITEVVVANRSILNPADITALASGSAWSNIDSHDVARLADSLTSSYEFRPVSGNHVSGWTESTEYYYTTTPEEEVISKWTDIPNGTYHLILGGLQDHQIISVSIRLLNDEFGEYSLPLVGDNDSHVLYGIVTIGDTDDSLSTPENTLEIKIKNEFDGLSTFSYILLAPKVEVQGRLNINTAPAEVLVALPGVTSDIAENIIAERPYGNKDGLHNGAGDLLKTDVLGSVEEKRLELFRKLFGLITARSNYYSIVATGQILDQERPIATRVVEIVTKRQQE